MGTISGSPSRESSGANLATLAGRSPKTVRGWIRNTVLADDESTDFEHTMMFRFRPAPVNQNINVVYDKSGAIGMSHQYHNYQYTDNFSWNFELYANSLMILKENAQQRPRAAYEGSDLDLELLSKELEMDRRFLEAASLPYRSPIGIIGASPPPLILCVPGIVTVRCRLMSLSFVFADSDLNGNIKEYRASATFEEAPLSRLTMRDQLTTGCFRTWGG